MKRIRINNDFTFAWAIERNGLPEDLSTAINMVLQARNSAGTLQTITDYDVAGNIVSVEVTPEIANVLGRYVFILTYELPDAGLSDLERLCEIDTDAFILVPRTAEADDAEDLLVTSDMAIGFKGDKGDPFLYSDFTPEQLESLKVKGDPFLYTDFTPEQIVELQKPATDAATAVNEAEALRVTAETTRVENEQGRLTAEGTRQSNEIARGNSEDDREDAEELRLSAEITRGQNEQARKDAEEIRVTAEGTRQTNTAIAITNANNAATNANTKAGLADTAANNANEKATLANNAATLANEKAGLANTAATNADNARLAIQTDLGLKLDKSAVKQVLGASTTDVMSQKAVTDELAKKHQVVVDYTHTGNKEVNIESIDFATGTITATGHGLAVNNIVFPINKGVGNFPFSALPNGINPLTSYFVINVTPNTFQLSLSYGGAPIVISDKATKDYSKWHLESIGGAEINGLSLRKFTVEIQGNPSGSQMIGDYFYLRGGKNYGAANPVWFTDTEYGKIAYGLSRSIFKSMANGDIWSYNKLEIDVTGKRATILINGYRIYSITETTVGIIRHNNEVAVHSSVGEDIVTFFGQINIFNGMNIKVTKIL